MEACCSRVCIVGTDLFLAGVPCSEFLGGAPHFKCNLGKSEFPIPPPSKEEVERQIGLAG